MNFLEAISSGKPFKRPGCGDWIIENPKALKRKSGISVTEKTEKILRGSAFIWVRTKKAVFFAKSTLIAEDWEIKE